MATTNLVKKALSGGFGFFSNDTFTAIFEEKNIFQLAALYKVAKMIAQSEGSSEDQKGQFSVIVSLIRIRVEELKSHPVMGSDDGNKFNELIGM